MKVWDRDKSKRLTEMLTQLVTVDTCQPRGGEAKLVKIVRSWFSPFADRVTMTDFDHGSGRSSLVIKLNADKADGGLAFIGHLDTVAVGDISLWTVDPFGAEVVGGKLFGRGSADMKAGVAAMCFAALELLETRQSLLEPIIFALTADEEKGFLGARAVTDSGLLKDVRGVVIPEPTGNKIGIAEKGALWLRLTVHGRLAHGSMPDAGINAIDVGFDFFQKFKKHVATYQSDRMLGPVTASLTQFEAGVLTNVIPDRAVLEIDCRTLPSVSHAELLRWTDTLISALKEKYSGGHIEIELLKNAAAVATDEEDPFVRDVQGEAVNCGLSIEPIALTYYTDAGLLIPVIKKPFVICGPGEARMAHQIDESVDLNQVAAAARLYTGLMTMYAFRLT